MFYLRGALKTYYAGRPDVYVAGNNFVFWEEGNPKARISPDAYVVFGSTPHLRGLVHGVEGGWPIACRHLRNHVPQDSARGHGQQIAAL